VLSQPHPPSLFPFKNEFLCSTTFDFFEHHWCQKASQRCSGKVLEGKTWQIIFLIFNLLWCLVFSLSRPSIRSNVSGTEGHAVINSSGILKMLLSLREPREPFTASSHQMVLASGCRHQGTPNSRGWLCVCRSWVLLNTPGSASAPVWLSFSYFCF